MRSPLMLAAIAAFRDNNDISAAVSDVELVTALQDASAKVAQSMPGIFDAARFLKGGFMYEAAEEMYMRYVAAEEARIAFARAAFLIDMAQDCLTLVCRGREPARVTQHQPHNIAHALRWLRVPAEFLPGYLRKAPPEVDAGSSDTAAPDLSWLDKEEAERQALAEQPSVAPPLVAVDAATGAEVPVAVYTGQAALDMVKAAQDANAAAGRPDVDAPAVEPVQDAPAAAPPVPEMPKPDVDGAIARAGHNTGGACKVCRGICIFARG